jgi:hypothetical protein
MHRGIESCVCLSGELVEPVEPDFSTPQRDANTKPVNQKERIRDKEKYIRDLELRFKKIFGHKIKTLGLESVDCPVALRLIMKKCAEDVSSYDRKTGKIKKNILSHENDPILKQVPKRERLICEGILVDLYVAYESLKNLKNNK